MRVVEALRDMGYSIFVHDGALRYKCDHSTPPPQAAELLADLKRRKTEALAYLSIAWPPESAECEDKFGRGSARLYPLLNQLVATPLGPGKLWQVGAKRVGVVLSRNPDKVAFMPWHDIRPIARAGGFAP